MRDVRGTVLHDEARPAVDTRAKVEATPSAKPSASAAPPPVYTAPPAATQTSKTNALPPDMEGFREAY
jgi:hypothetical protein